MANIPQRGARALGLADHAKSPEMRKGLAIRQAIKKAKESTNNEVSEIIEPTEVINHQIKSSHSYEELSDNMQHIAEKYGLGNFQMDMSFDNNIDIPFSNVLLQEWQNKLGMGITTTQSSPSNHTRLQYVEELGIDVTFLPHFSKNNQSIDLQKVYDAYIHTLLYLLKNNYNKYRLYFDSLTGVGNRFGVDNKVQKKASNCLNEKRPFTFVCIDVNNLKFANDHYGHLSGDSILKIVADELKKEFAGSIYRTGGDEFVIYAEGMNKNKVLQMLDRVASEMNKYEFYDKENNQNIDYKLSCAIGVSQFDGHNASENWGNKWYDWLKAADDASYHAKELGKRNEEHPSGHKTVIVEYDRELERENNGDKTDIGARKKS